MNLGPNFFDKLRQGRAGLCVLAFTLLADAAFELFLHIYRWQGGWAVLLWMPAVTAAVVWATATRRWAPGAAGSGIPQVISALDSSLETGRRGRHQGHRPPPAGGWKGSRIWLTRGSGGFNSVDWRARRGASAGVARGCGIRGQRRSWRHPHEVCGWLAKDLDLRDVERGGLVVARVGITHQVAPLPQLSVTRQVERAVHVGIADVVP